MHYQARSATRFLRVASCLTQRLIAIYLFLTVTGCSPRTPAYITEVPVEKPLGDSLRKGIVENAHRTGEFRYSFQSEADGKGRTNGYLTISADGEKFEVEYQDGSRVEYRGSATWVRPQADPMGSVREQLLLWSLLLGLPDRLHDTTFELSESAGQTLELDGDACRKVSMTFSPAAKNVPALWLNLFIGHDKLLHGALVENKNLIGDPQCKKVLARYRSGSANKVELWCWDDAANNVRGSSPRAQLILESQLGKES